MNRNLTPSSLSKIRLLAGNIYQRLSTKELTKMNWPKTTFSRKNCREGTVKSNLVFKSQENNASKLRLYLDRRRELDGVVYSMHPSLK